MNEPKTRSCWNCGHMPVCQYTPASFRNVSKHPPFISDDHIGDFLNETGMAFAKACSCYKAEPE